MHFISPPCHPVDSGYKGLWHRKQHMKQRSRCLDLLKKAYGQLYLEECSRQVSDETDIWCQHRRIIPTNDLSTPYTCTPLCSSTWLYFKQFSHYLSDYMYMHICMLMYMYFNPFTHYSHLSFCLHWKTLYFYIVKIKFHSNNLVMSINIITI